MWPAPPPGVGMAGTVPSGGGSWPGPIRMTPRGIGNALPHRSDRRAGDVAGGGGGGEGGVDPGVALARRDVGQIASAEALGVEIAAPDRAGRAGEPPQPQRIEGRGKPLADAARLAEVEAVADQLRRHDAGPGPDIIGDVAGAPATAADNSTSGKQRIEQPPRARSISTPARECTPFPPLDPAGASGL